MPGGGGSAAREDLLRDAELAAPRLGSRGALAELPGEDVGLARRSSTQLGAGTDVADPRLGVDRPDDGRARRADRHLHRNELVPRVAEELVVLGQVAALDDDPREQTVVVEGGDRQGLRLGGRHVAVDLVLQGDVADLGARGLQVVRLDARVDQRVVHGVEQERLGGDCRARDPVDDTGLERDILATDECLEDDRLADRRDDPATDHLDDTRGNLDLRLRRGDTLVTRQPVGLGVGIRQVDVALRDVRPDLDHLAREGVLARNDLDPLAVDQRLEADERRRRCDHVPTADLDGRGGDVELRRFALRDGDRDEWVVTVDLGPVAELDLVRTRRQPLNLVGVGAGGQLADLLVVDVQPRVVRVDAVADRHRAAGTVGRADGADDLDPVTLGLGRTLGLRGPVDPDRPLVLVAVRPADAGCDRVGPVLAEVDLGPVARLDALGGLVGHRGVELHATLLGGVADRDRDVAVTGGRSTHLEGRLGLVVVLLAGAGSASTRDADDRSYRKGCRGTDETVTHERNSSYSIGCDGARAGPTSCSPGWVAPGTSL